MQTAATRRRKTPFSSSKNGDDWLILDFLTMFFSSLRVWILSEKCLCWTLAMMMREARRYSDAVIPAFGFSLEAFVCCFALKNEQNFERMMTPKTNFSQDDAYRAISRMKSVLGVATSATSSASSSTSTPNGQIGHSSGGKWRKDGPS